MRVGVALQSMFCQIFCPSLIFFTKQEEGKERWLEGEIPGYGQKDKKQKLEKNFKILQG
jgi:hypothetical protein